MSEPRHAFLLLLASVGEKKLIFFVSHKAIWPHPTIITWEIVRTGPRDNSEDDFGNKVSFEDYDQDVLAED